MPTLIKYNGRSEKLEIGPPTKEIISYLKWASYIAIDLYSMQKDNFPYEEADAWLRKAENMQALIFVSEAERDQAKATPIPEQVLKIAEALEPGYRDQQDIFKETVIAAAWRIYNAGFRYVENATAE
jgi:hypothetical protein